MIPMGKKGNKVKYSIRKFLSGSKPEERAKYRQEKELLLSQSGSLNRYFRLEH